MSKAETEEKAREFRVEILRRIAGIESLIEKENCEYQQTLISCLKEIDRFLDKNKFISL